MKNLCKKKCKVLSIDRDPETLDVAKKIKKKYKNRFLFQNGKFSQIENFLEFFNPNNSLKAENSTLLKIKNLWSNLRTW